MDHAAADTSRCDSTFLGLGQRPQRIGLIATEARVEQSLQQQTAALINRTLLGIGADSRSAFGDKADIEFGPRDVCI
jgi:hypothetical protein